MPCRVSDNRPDRSVAVLGPCSASEARMARRLVSASAAKTLADTSSGSGRIEVLPPKREAALGASVGRVPRCGLIRKRCRPASSRRWPTPAAGPSSPRWPSTDRAPPPTCPAGCPSPGRASPSTWAARRRRPGDAAAPAAADGCSSGTGPEPIKVAQSLA